MSRYLTSRRLFLLLGSIILLMIIAGLTFSRTGRKASWPEQVVMNVENTVSGWVYRPVSKLTGFLGGLHNLRDMYQENAQLQNEMLNYQSLKAQLNDANTEIKQLRIMAGFVKQNKDTLHPIAAQVVGRSPSLWNSELTIDVGSKDGVGPNMAVVSPDGSLVGRIEKVATHSAKVVLITDTQVGDGVSALAQTPSSQPFGVVTGSTRNQGALDMTFWGSLVQLSTKQLIGDEVVTSGLSDIFPKGIVIGKITKVQYGAHNSVQTAVVQPQANLDYLQYVFVVRTNKQMGQLK